MRTIVFFDLPVSTHQDRKNYAKFRKSLINEGFIMLQNSVYSKITLNGQQAELLKTRIKKLSPKQGIIQILTLTENQYSSIEYIIGESVSNVINTDERMIVL